MAGEIRAVRDEDADRRAVRAHLVDDRAARIDDDDGLDVRQLLAHARERRRRGVDAVELDGLGDVLRRQPQASEMQRQSIGGEIGVFTKRARLALDPVVVPSDTGDGGHHCAGQGDP